MTIQTWGAFCEPRKLVIIDERPDIDHATFAQMIKRDKSELRDRLFNAAILGTLNYFRQHPLPQPKTRNPTMAEETQTSAPPPATATRTKRQKFEELALSRTETVLDRIRVLRGLSNKDSYDYTPQHVERVFSSIQRELDDAKREFLGIQKPAVDFSDLIEGIPE